MPTITEDKKTEFFKDLCKLPLPESEDTLVARYYANPVLTKGECGDAQKLAKTIVKAARSVPQKSLIEQLTSIYSLSLPEGKALMALAEALLRIPDAQTRDILIQDKICDRDWSVKTSGVFLKMAGLSLQMADWIINPQTDRHFKNILPRLGMPIIRQAVQTGIKLLGKQFVMAEDITKACRKAKLSKASLYSFDMLGEAARTEEDAENYWETYREAIQTISAFATAEHVHDNHGISIKLSALYAHYHPRYWSEIENFLLPRLLDLVLLAKKGHIPLTIDAEESARLSLSFPLVEKLLDNPRLSGWPGIGMVVQAYNRQAGSLIDYLVKKARSSKTPIAIRLVKGAYWDSEIKIFQEKGLDDFPVYTQKHHTDLAYLAHAKQLIQHHQWVYAQFASHNAFTLAAVDCLARKEGISVFEVQKLYGMGQDIHDAYRKNCGHRSRIYAPVGHQRDLLAYLVRRLLENGANSSFINQLSNENIPLSALTVDPYQIKSIKSAIIKTGRTLFEPVRINSHGQDLEAGKVLHGWALTLQKISLPPLPKETKNDESKGFFIEARQALKAWQQYGFDQRAVCLEKISDFYEKETSHLISLLVAEAGKTVDDALSEIREAVDFCRYYAVMARRLPKETSPRGVVLTIAPWNFPLAIFTGQIVAALVAGNAVIAKAAEQTPRIASYAVKLMHQAGVPKQILHLALGRGEILGHHLTRFGGADMVAFTGSNETARLIEAALASSKRPDTPLVAETGGVNVMIVDSTALLERASDDIVMSAFHSAGQRCSAVRLVYVQEDIIQPLIKMLIGAARILRIGDPRDLSVDIGPVIDEEAKNRIDHYVKTCEKNLIWQGKTPSKGCFCAPTMIRVKGIDDIETEIFGPVLHIASYKNGEEEKIIEEINAKNYGLTFGIQSRIQKRAYHWADSIDAGNIYINRNQIGAVVESQPFGGHALSGTGPKAGGPLYLGAFTKSAKPEKNYHGVCSMPGPDGEKNTYRRFARGVVLCLEPDRAKRKILVKRAKQAGNRVVEMPSIPSSFSGIDAVMIDAIDTLDVTALRLVMSQSQGPMIPLISDRGGECWLYQEKHICEDITAAGGNPELFALIS